MTINKTAKEVEAKVDQDGIPRCFICGNTLEECNKVAEETGHDECEDLARRNALVTNVIELASHYLQPQIRMVCDETTNSAEDIKAGIMRVVLTPLTPLGAQILSRVKRVIPT